MILFERDARSRSPADSGLRLRHPQHPTRTVRCAPTCLHRSRLSPREVIDTATSRAAEVLRLLACDRYPHRRTRPERTAREPAARPARTVLEPARSTNPTRTQHAPTPHFRSTSTDSCQCRCIFSRASRSLPVVHPLKVAIDAEQSGQPLRRRRDSHPAVTAGITPSRICYIRSDFGRSIFYSWSASHSDWPAHEIQCRAWHRSATSRGSKPSTISPHCSYIFSTK